MELPFVIPKQHLKGYGSIYGTSLLKMGNINPEITPNVIEWDACLQVTDLDYQSYDHVPLNITYHLWWEKEESPINLPLIKVEMLSCFSKNPFGKSITFPDHIKPKRIVTNRNINVNCENAKVFSIESDYPLELPRSFRHSKVEMLSFSYFNDWNISKFPATLKHIVCPYEMTKLEPFKFFLLDYLKIYGKDIIINTMGGWFKVSMMYISIEERNKWEILELLKTIPLPICEEIVPHIFPVSDPNVLP